MRPRIILTVILAAALSTVACRKDKETPNTWADCTQLKAGIAAADKEAVRAVINALISQLPNRQHTPENLAQLVARIGNQCQVTATVFCYACIYTLPAQSEINVKLVGSNAISKVIDISEDKNKDMIFVNMHE